MAKQSGLADNAYVGGVDMSGDITALSKIGGGPAVLDVTSINRSAYERIGGLRTGEISFTSWFNDNAAANRAAAVGSSFHKLSSLPLTDTHAMYCRGTTIGSPAACCVAKQINHDMTRAADGSLTFEVQALSNGYGIEWGNLLTAGLRTDTANTNGASWDNGAAGAQGAQAYIQCTSITATNFTAAVQESSDDGAGDPFAAVVGLTFTAITAAPAFERKATAQPLAVERYLRVATTGTWAGGNAVFAVAVVVNSAAVLF